VSLPIAILAGGLATRMRPLTDDRPKILIDVGGRPFAVRQIELLKQGGVSHVVYCLGYRGEQVVGALGDGSQFGMTFDYVFDGPRLLGTGGALKRALPRLGPAFFVMYGDSYLECDMPAVERAFRSSGKLGLMTVFRNEDRWGRSNVVYSEGRIVRYDKAATNDRMQHIDYGLGVLAAEAFEPWGNSDERFDLSEVYQRLIDRDELAGFEVGERFYEIGSPEGLEETRARIGMRIRSAR
jgi:NDP-sugar pyrophosphorylase family protein